MSRSSKIILKDKISQKTMEAIRIYLREFVAGRHVIEHFDGTVSIYVYEKADVEVMQRNFPSVIANVRDLY